MTSPPSDLPQLTTPQAIVTTPPSRSKDIQEQLTEVKAAYKSDLSPASPSPSKDRRSGPNWRSIPKIFLIIKMFFFFFFFFSLDSVLVSFLFYLFIFHLIQSFQICCSLFLFFILFIDWSGILVTVVNIWKSLISIWFLNVFENLLEFHFYIFSIMNINITIC